MLKWCRPLITGRHREYQRRVRSGEQDAHPLLAHLGRLSSGALGHVERDLAGGRAGRVLHGMGRRRNGVLRFVGSFHHIVEAICGATLVLPLAGGCRALRRLNSIQQASFACIHLTARANWASSAQADGQEGRDGHLPAARSLARLDGAGPCTVVAGETWLRTVPSRECSEWQLSVSYKAADRAIEARYKVFHKSR